MVEENRKDDESDQLMGPFANYLQQCGIIPQLRS